MGRVTDPAAGAGALLVPPLRQFVSASNNPREGLVEVRTRFSGRDLDPIAVWLGNLILASELLPLWAQVPADDRRPLPTLLQVGDGLDKQCDQPETILMNPPWGRVRLLPSERERWQLSLHGHANRYGVFLHSAIEQVADGGLVAALIPTSFLGGAYFKRLRAFAGEQAPLERIVFVTSRTGVFGGDVLQESCVALFRKGGGRRYVDCSTISVNGKFELTRSVRVEVVQGDLPWLLPRRKEDKRLVAAASRLGNRLSDYGWRASTGPLVWNRHKPRIAASKGVGAVPIVWAADLDSGFVHPDPARDQQRYVTLRDRDAFMRLAEPALLVQRTTAPEQPRRLVLAVLDKTTLDTWGGAVVVENHVNILRCSEQTSPLSVELLARLLRTDTFDRLYRCLTGSVAVSAYELNALPLPDTDTLRRWSRLGFEELSVQVARLYGSHGPANP